MYIFKHGIEVYLDHPLSFTLSQYPPHQHDIIRKAYYAARASQTGSTWHSRRSYDDCCRYYISHVSRASALVTVADTLIHHAHGQVLQCPSLPRGIKRYIQLSDINVPPECRGEGIGSIILQYAEALARLKGIPYLSVEFKPADVERDTASTAWLERRGYQLYMMQTDRVILRRRIPPEADETAPVINEKDWMAYSGMAAPYHCVFNDRREKRLPPRSWEEWTPDGFPTDKAVLVATSEDNRPKHTPTAEELNAAVLRSLADEPINTEFYNDPDLPEEEAEPAAETDPDTPVAETVKPRRRTSRAKK